jgi:hypothetical protein
MGIVDCDAFSDSLSIPIQKNLTSKKLLLGDLFKNSKMPAIVASKVCTGTHSECLLRCPDSKVAELPTNLSGNFRPHKRDKISERRPEAAVRRY